VLRPAEGLELALLTAGAYNGKDSEWKAVRRDCFIRNYTRIPVRVPIRNLWLPAGCIKEDKNLAGVLIERDMQGSGLTTKMQIPENFSGWKEEDGIFYLQDKNLTLVPKSRYKIGEHRKDSFAKDGYAQAVLTPEGAELFAKTAYDTGKTLWIYGINVSNIAESEQRVSLLGEDRRGLHLDGNVWYDNRDGHAFGVVHERPSLTKREREVLVLFAEGLPYKEIAEKLGISPGTINVHNARAYRKLGVHSRNEVKKIINFISREERHS
jgi:DNA-binding CsgD family transcriptional regulator